jgi:hypothetical protein
MDDNMATVREEARRKGGEELVAKIDAAAAEEREFTKLLDERISKALEQPEGDDRKIALAALTEALSATLGRVTVAYASATETPDAQIMVMAIRSLVGSVQIAIDDRTAADNDVAAMIKKGWTKPEGGF